MKVRIFLLNAFPIVAAGTVCIAGAQEFRLVKGQAYKSLDALFCVNKPALENLIAERQRGNISSVPSGCFNAPITYIPEYKVKDIAVDNEFAVLDPTGPRTCTLESGEQKNCRLQAIKSGFIAALMEYRGKTIRIYIAVNNSFEVVASDDDRVPQ